MKPIIILTALALLAGVPEATAQKKQYSDYNLRRASELMDENKYQEAGRLIDQHLKEFPNDSDAHILRGCKYRDEGYVDYAIAEYGKALEFWNKRTRTPKYAIYRGRAELYMQLKEYDKALLDLS